MKEGTLPRKTLGSFLREQRQSNGLSIRNLIAQIQQSSSSTDSKNDKISAAYICDIENSRRQPTDRVLSLLAKTLNIDEEDMQRHDSRVPGQELQDLAQVNAQYGMAFRRMIKHIHDTNLDPQELLDRIINVEGNLNNE